MKLKNGGRKLRNVWKKMRNSGRKWRNEVDDLETFQKHFYNINKRYVTLSATRKI